MSNNLTITIVQPIPTVTIGLLYGIPFTLIWLIGFAWRFMGATYQRSFGLIATLDSITYRPKRWWRLCDYGCIHQDPNHVVLWHKAIRNIPCGIIELFVILVDFFQFMSFNFTAESPLERELHARKLFIFFRTFGINFSSVYTDRVMLWMAVGCGFLMCCLCYGLSWKVGQSWNMASKDNNDKPLCLQVILHPIPVFGDVIAMILFGVLFVIVDCAYPKDAPPYLYRNQNMSCWKGQHIALGALAILCIIGVFIGWHSVRSASLFEDYTMEGSNMNLHMNETYANDRVSTSSSYMFLKLQLKIALIALEIFMNLRYTLYLSGTLAFNILWLIITLYFSLPNSQGIFAVIVTGNLIVIYTNLCAMFLYFFDSSVNIVMLLLSGYSSILIVALASFFFSNTIIAHLTHSSSSFEGLSALSREGSSSSSYVILSHTNSSGK